MASISVPCPKCSVISCNGAWNRCSSSRRSFSASFNKPGSSSDRTSARFPSSKDSSYEKFPILKAHFNEVAVENSSNSSPLVSTKPETSITKSKDAAVKEESSGQIAVPDTIISAFMDEVSIFVKIAFKERRMRAPNKKKRSLTSAASCHLMDDGISTGSTPSSTFSSSLCFSTAPARPLALRPPSNVGNKSSAPPLNCRMAGTFYRSPGPGEPPFVKVGDKVQKGQVVCIIEAMKLMNEIEGDQSGTIVEILADDGKPVSVDTPLLIIQP